MNTTLVIMAAGLGSRYGGGIKQLAPVGPNGEIIMDYSIHDAITAGFDKIIFIIRKDIEADFREVIGNRIEKICAKHGVEVAYAFQEMDNLPGGRVSPVGRKKPWGTGQAVLACKDMIMEPFAVINADDYYGKESFKQMHDYLVDYRVCEFGEFCMAGFVLKNTLSDNGGVTRGICRIVDGYLADIEETKHIIHTENGAEADGKRLDPDSYVSMNMWGLTPYFMVALEEGFSDFLRGLTEETMLTAEFLIPVFIGEMVKQGKANVAVLPTSEKWFGVTYAEDKPAVEAAIQKLIAEGVYQKALFADL